MVTSDAIRKRLTQIRITQSGRKFCTSCQREALVSDGKDHRMANGKARFVCGACVRKMDKLTGRAA